jgi:hypothetical protein
MACNSSFKAPASKLCRDEMIEGNANPFSAAPPLPLSQRSCADFGTMKG